MLQALQQIPLPPMEKTMVEQFVHLQPTEDHARQDTHTAAGACALKEAAAHGEPTQEQVPAGTVAPMGPTLEQSFPDGLYTTERTHAIAVLEELQPVRRNHVGAVDEGLYFTGGTPC